MASGEDKLYFQAPSGMAGIKLCIEDIGKSALLSKKENFSGRIEAIDFIEFEIAGQLEALLQKTEQPEELILLRQDSEKVKRHLEEINDKIVQKLRGDIRAGRYRAKNFRQMIHQYLDINLRSGEFMQKAGYDNLDILMNHLLSFGAMPEQTKDLEHEMVFYQKTPARIVLELVEKADFNKDDVFFDLGSGLGQAAMQVNLLSGIAACGIEFEPAFCNYASECARQLNLTGVTFINEDVRQADYSKGTAFFMYTPFEGKMLQEVLAILHKEAQSRRIRIFTYGPCTSLVALQDWLDYSGPDTGSLYTLGVFDSA